MFVPTKQDDKEKAYELKDLKEYNLELKAFEDDEGKHKFKALGSTFGNIDSYGDIVEQGAFKKTIREAKRNNKMPKLLWQHWSSEIPGLITNLKETEEGLIVEGEFINTTLGKDVYEQVKTGAISDMSIGFKAEKYEIDEIRKARKIQQIKLYEVSFVTFPANPKANVLAVKNKPQTEREFELFLRDAGYSRSESKQIVSEGFKVSYDQRDADDQEIKNVNDKLDLLISK